MATTADSESLLDYHRRASDVGLSNCEEFQRLLAILQGEAIAVPEPEPLRVIIPAFHHLVLLSCVRADVSRSCVHMISDMVIIFPRKVMRKMSHKKRGTGKQHCLAGEMAWHYRTFPTSKLLSS